MITTPAPSPDDARVTRQRSTLAIIGVIVAMLAIIVASFAYVSGQEDQLRAGRTESRDFRKARQALVEADLAVLTAFTTDRIDDRAYDAAIDKLSRHGPEHFPAAIDVDGRSVSGDALVGDLKASWRGTIDRIEADDLAGARALYGAQGVTKKMTAILATTVRRIEQLDASNDQAQENIDWTIKAVVVLQLISGLFCILVFTRAARRGATEARARAQAMGTATRSREEVMRLFEMTDMLQSAQDQTDANAVLRATALELLPDLGGTLYVFNNSRDRLVLSDSWNLNGGPAPAEMIAVSQCWALKRGKPHLNQPAGDRLCCDHHPGGVHILEIPMAARGEVLGLLCLRAPGENGEARLTEIAGLGAALSDAMSLALANLALGAKLRSQALRDPLTGLYNRRYMEDTLQRVSQLAQRENQPVSIIMIDLDHFKRLNDQHGHAKGDAVLRDAAKVILNQLRDSDVACRYGGEELLVVMPNCPIEDAAAKAERLRLGIAALSQPGVAVSASLGVAAIPTTSAGVSDLVQAADAALYAAKEAGRNRVVTASPLEDWGAPELLAAE